MEPVPGLVVGPYRLVEPIGEGGMGIVWKARDTTLDRDVAIKFLPSAFARDPDRLARFEREAKAVAALSHPAILAIYGFGEHEGTAYAVTELLQGETLREILARGPLPPERVRDVAHQIARGLAAAHDRGIVHRDLKPDNVFLARDGHVKILDFGLAAYVPARGPGAGAASDASSTPTRTSLTTPGTVLGTIDYLSPEQVRGLSADTRSDVFSFGSMLVEMTTGRRPFQRETAAETMTAILREEPASVGSVSPRLEAIARRCLAKLPEDRFASARPLADALAEPDATASDGRSRKRLLPALVVGAALAIAVASMAAWTWRAYFDGRANAGPASDANVTSIGEPPSKVPEANEYFEKGLLFMRAQYDLPRAQQMLSRAVELDPSFGSARAMRALTSLIAIHQGASSDGDEIYRVERDMRELVASQPGLASAHATLGAALLYLDKKEQARAEFAKAQRLNARSQPAAMWMVVDAHHSGRLGEAESRARKILAGVPLFWAARISLADVLHDEGRVDDARREIRKIFEQDSKNLAATLDMARLDLEDGDTAHARALLEGISAGAIPNFRARLAWALLLAREGRRDAAAKELDPQTLKYATIAFFAPAQVAEIYALAGRTDDALHWLDRAVRNGDERAAWLRRDPLLASIRAQPRFHLILEAMERGGT